MCDFFLHQIWELWYPTKLKYSVDMKEKLDWILTQYAVFNKTDEYLLVCGVNVSGVFYDEFFMGHGAIFDMKGICSNKTGDIRYRPFSS